MDDDSLELVKASASGAVEGALEPVTRFLETIGGPAGRELAELWADRIRARRVRTQIKVVQKTQTMLEEAGLPFHTVDLKTLVPLLEFAGLEDEGDETMQEMWAALLANAAAGDLGADVLPSFPRILAELSPAEAAMLAELYREFETVSGAAGTIFDWLPMERRLRDIVPASKDEFDVWLENLVRLGLCRITRGDLEILAAKTGRPEIGGATISRTQLGNAFVTACKPL